MMLQGITQLGHFISLVAQVWAKDHISICSIKLQPESCMQKAISDHCSSAKMLPLSLLHPVTENLKYKGRAIQRLPRLPSSVVPPSSSCRRTAWATPPVESFKY
jgi:hypothetical protein